MKAIGRIFWTLVWLGALAIAGSVFLTIAASRVGEHKSSTYGAAYGQFQSAWGGEIGIIPPRFALERTYSVQVYNTESKEYQPQERKEEIPLTPQSIDIDATVDYGEQRRAMLRFNAFEAHNTEIYRITNNSGFVGRLLVYLSKPENANLMYEYTVATKGQDAASIPPTLAGPYTVVPTMGLGEQRDVTITYATKGMDTLKYNLSAYQDKVIGSLQATLKLNTKSFEVYRFGLPHQVEQTAEGAIVRFSVQNFATTQDLGITFDSKQLYLDQVQNLMSYSPLSLILYLVALFIYVQIHGLRFNMLHYLFILAINVFYFLFLSYLIRFFDAGLSFAISTALTAGMFVVYCPNVLGWRFAGRVAGVYLFLLTVVYSLVFMMPILRGLLFVGMVFAVFLSIMIPVSRSNIAQWPIVSGEGPEQPS